MVVSDIDIRLLKVFKAVVESGGYARAQTILGVSQSTISTQMSQLEVRVGYSLCHRGRSGFRLTSEGEDFYELTKELFRSIIQFQTQVSELKEGLSGTLKIAFLDNVISDNKNPLKNALSKFVRHPENTVQIKLESLPPADMEKGLLNGSLDIAIGIFDDHVSGLHYKPLYEEHDVLACHHSHPLAKIDNAHVLGNALPATKKIVREFIGRREYPFDDFSEVSASVTSLEASTMLILTGQYIGFLPKHYAKPWLDVGELVALVPENFNRVSQFSLVTKDSVQSQSRSLELLVSCIVDSCSDRTDRTQDIL
ncbi:MAG: DNA-binding transcriptional LysR family regulator [Patiriisocius sp.]|jgi:DNA-binding transcriptional LysR family regulator